MLIEKRIEGLESKLEYCFKDKKLLELALSHSSYINEQTNKNKQCNERIEFLGDAILEMVSSEYLYKNRPVDKEGPPPCRIRCGFACTRTDRHHTLRINTAR